MALRIYTKTGDQGKTSLLGGQKLSKSDLRIEAYGTVDELNSFLGLLRDQMTDEPLRQQLLNIQDRLFTIGSLLAVAPDRELKMNIPELAEEDVLALEKEIDRMDDQLPPMKSFVLPGGHPIVSTAHIVRCVCRRAERCCVRLQESGSPVDGLTIKYLNRLSDYFFMLARHLAQTLKAEEIPWKPRI